MFKWLKDFFFKKEVSLVEVIEDKPIEIEPLPKI